MNQEKINFAPYRSEIIINDLFHKSLAVLLVLIIIGLTITTNVTGNANYIWYVPLLTISLLGTIIRLDTMVHRMGWFLEKSGEPWERDRKKLLYDRIHLTFGDIFMLVPVILCLFQSYASILQTPISWSNLAYFAISLLLTLFGIVLWAVTPSMVRKT